MQTDIPLKVLTRHCAADLLALLGTPNSQVLSVETLELPAGKTALGNLLRLRDTTGKQYLHLVEWQAYRDERLFWRVLGYLGQIGQRLKQRPILVTIIYLKPGDDTGDTLVQRLADGNGWEIRFGRVRLWEQSAQQALQSGLPGLLALAPLMQGATSELVIEAAEQIIAQGATPVQADLLVALGIFAEPLFARRRFEQLVTRERLMQSELLRSLTSELVEEGMRKAEARTREAEARTRKAEARAREAEARARETETLHQMQYAFTVLTAARFPESSAIISRVLMIRDIAMVERLIGVAAKAPDLNTLDAAVPHE